MHIAGGGVRFHTIAHASIIFASAAHRFSLDAQRLDNPEIYNTLDERGRGRIEAELLDISLAAVLTANLAVEATVNELYLDVSLFPGEGNGMFKGLTLDIRRALFDAWEHGAEGYP